VNDYNPYDIWEDVDGGRETEEIKAEEKKPDAPVSQSGARPVYIAFLRTRLPRDLFR